MDPRHRRSLFPILLLIYASSTPDNNTPGNLARADQLAETSDDVGVEGRGGVVLETVADVPPSEASSRYYEDIGFHNNTQNSLFILMATGDGPREMVEPSSHPPTLHVLSPSTTITTEQTTPVMATIPQYKRLPLGALSGVGITVPTRKPWLPPLHHDAHHHGGTSRFGPYFEEGAGGSNVTARLGSTVRLDCKIGMLQDKTVTWLHRKDDAIHLLTVGRQAYSSDSRFSLAYRYPNNWRLQILFVTRRDEGLYECQVATHPTRVRKVFLRVTAPELKIVDEDGHEVLERYYKAGSEVELTCLALQLEEGDGEVDPEGGTEERRGVTTPKPPAHPLREVRDRVLWRHGDSVILRNSSGRGIGVKVSADGRNVSVMLTLRAAKKADGGNYTCSVGGLTSATVSIHILNGELPAAVQYGNSTLPFGAVSLLLQLCCLAFSLCNFLR